MTRRARLTTDFDAVLASAPLDKAAGRVTSRGFHHDADAPEHHVHRDAPLPLPSLSAQAIRTRDGWGTFTDYTGRKIGRFTVMGCLGKPNPKKKTRWQVRCVCGAYEQRTTPAIAKWVSGEHSADAAMCIKCAHLERLRKEGAHTKGRGKIAWRAADLFGRGR